MSKTFLLEIGLEEMPAHVVTPSVEQLENRVEDFLDKNHLAYESVRPYSTPRRLAVMVEGLADKQDDIEVDAKGPAKKIAVDADGNWTKAAKGFARGQKSDPDQIVFKDLKGTEYAYIHKLIPGKPAAEVLQGLDKVVEAMTFPTRMHWHTYHFEYIRPIHWIVALLDDQVIDFQVLNIKTGRQTQGHRFLGEPVALKQASDYQQALADQFVIADAEDRKNMIRQQINQMAAEQNWQVVLDADLLEEVNNLVEYPTAFYGTFEKRFLDIPEAVLITSMKDNQRYFYVRDQNGKLLPYFISVRNGDKAHLENVVHGNEKVLTARLEDAAFFYQEDQKHTIDDYVERLKKVSFHDKIGSMYAKMLRVHAIAHFLGEKYQLSNQEMKDLDRASMIYKFDLVTSMVGEFSELQGVMGEVYAKLAGEDENVAVAIREHYMPTSSEGELPQTSVGSVLALADKIDSIGAFFSVDMIPNGSNDPYALRRQAYGIVRIVEDHGWHLPIGKVENEVARVLTDAGVTDGLDVTKNQKEVLDFMLDRMRQWLGNAAVRHDIIDAVVESSSEDPLTMFAAAKTLEAHKDDDDFKDTIEAVTRVLRLDAKADFDENTDLTVDPSLFENDSEKQLNEAVIDLSEKWFDQTIEEDYQSLRELRPLIDEYFDQTMIMDKNEQVRDNRLKQLAQVAKLANVLGDLNQLVVK
ncbi:glyS protein [Lactobacillus selangorensis]|uniref:Glycine--tRNA ligase beta subunit n=1 Tax=Lactobacillus selangorensis TaxID=81857 RepID=A0A0R2FLY3_9LACO|nr:glycine--tRNA ligase subunit beta [Lactobacillus selangorensis]KRN29520.1 glyS protein [Lactobacillus selangorensis]KRN33950.1 glyS protein [Lactobacillus selangorensis]